jgi:hypothetical protein
MYVPYYLLMCVFCLSGVWGMCLHLTLRSLNTNWLTEEHFMDILTDISTRTNEIRYVICLCNRGSECTYRNIADNSWFQCVNPIQIMPYVQSQRLYAAELMLWGTNKKNSVAWVRERSIPTEWQPFVAEVSADFCGYISRIIDFHLILNGRKPVYCNSLSNFLPLKHLSPV